MAKSNELVSRPVNDIEQLLNNEFKSDIVFLVGKKEKKMFGHRIFLEVASDVFYAMFNSDFKENNESSVKISDIEPDVFLELLRFIYCKRANVTKINLVPLYAGKESFEYKNVTNIVFHIPKFAKIIIFNSC